MILYNLRQYLVNEFPLEKIIAGSLRNPDDRIIQIIDNGGVPTAWFNFVSESIQIMVRDKDNPAAFLLAKQVYEEINNRFGLILPANTVNGNVYPEIQTAQISANQTPGYIGDDKNGRAMYSTNYRVIY